MSIYVAQTALNYIMTVKNAVTGLPIDLTGSTVLIKAKKPSGAIVSYSATITDAVNGVAEYQVQSGDIDITGQWNFWAHVTFPDSTVAMGSVHREVVLPEGQ